MKGIEKQKKQDLINTFEHIVSDSLLQLGCSHNSKNVAAVTARHFVNHLELITKYLSDLECFKDE